MPERPVDQPLIVEAAGVEYIPERERHGQPTNQFTIRFSPVIYLAPIFLGGAAIPLGLGLTGSITAIVLANLLGCIAAGLCAGMGPKLGMPQLVQSRASFGYIGNYIPAILASVLFIGYSTVGTIVGAKAMETLLGLPYPPIAVAVAIASILLAVYGYELLHVTGKWVTWIGIVLLVIVTALTVMNGVGPGATAALTGTSWWLAWLLLFTIIFSFTVSWMLYASDYSRYLPVETKFGHVAGYASSGLFLGSTWMMVLGAALVSIAPEGGALEALDVVLPTGLLWLVLVSLTITSVTHNSVNLYSCSMAGLTWDFPLKRSTTAILAGLIAAVLAVLLGGTDFQENFNNFLILMSYFMLPWLAIRLIDFFWKRSHTAAPVEAFYRKDGRFGRVRWHGVAAFLIGIGVSIPFMSTTIYTGPIAESLQGADVSYFVSFIVAAAIYSFVKPAEPDADASAAEATAPQAQRSRAKVDLA